MAAPQREKRSTVAWSDGDAEPSRSGGGIRKLAIAASITLFILGAVHFGLNRYWGGAPAVNSTAQVIPDDAPLDPPQIAAPATLDQQSVALPPTVATPPRAPGNEASAPAPAIPVPNLDTTGTIRQPTMQAVSLPPASSPQASTARAHDPDRQTPASGGVGLRAAADNGDPAAAFELASRYADGRGVPQDLAEAAAWFERAATKGFAPAQFRLGSLYEKGIGVRKNLDTARRFYTAAAEAGHAKAMHNLAVLYAEGVEGKPNYTMAARWFRKAADHGVADSQYNLAILYARGIGVETNLAEAFKWFALASRDGDHDAGKKRDDIASRLDKKSLTAAMAAAKAWQPVPQPESAIDVSAPPGGWDAAPATTAKRGGPKANVQSRRPTQ
jgi:localization factor PodJL